MKKEALYLSIGAFAGAAVSGIVTFFVTKRVVWNKCEKEIDEMRKIYLEKIENGEAPVNSGKKEVPKEVREALMKNWDKPPLRATSEERSVEEEMAESEHPVDSDEDEEVDPLEERSLLTAMELEEEKRALKGKPPVIISEEEAAQLSAGFTSVDWTYYQLDDTMCDDDNQVVSSYRDIVGNVLDDTGWLTDEDADEIIVIVPDYMCVYRITKVLLAFSDTDYAGQQVYADIAEAYK